jgi:hypothetical protein
MGQKVCLTKAQRKVGLNRLGPSEEIINKELPFISSIKKKNTFGLSWNSPHTVYTRECELLPEDQLFSPPPGHTTGRGMEGGRQEQGHGEQQTVHMERESGAV